jgi:hypothetical protein
MREVDISNSAAVLVSQRPDRSSLHPLQLACVHSPPSGQSAVLKVVACTVRLQLADRLSHFNGKCATNAKKLHSS